MAETTLFLPAPALVPFFSGTPSWWLPLSSIPEKALQRCAALCACSGPPCAPAITLIDPRRLAYGK